MGVFDKVILISDIDGTLLYNGVIPKENIEAIEYFKSEGGLFTFATGRGAMAAKEIYDAIKCNAPAVVFQGGSVYDYETECFLKQDTLTLEDKLVAIDLLKKFPNVGFQAHNGHEIFVINENDGVWHHINYESLKYRIVTIDEVINLSWNKVVFFCDDEELYLDFKNYYQKLNYDKCFCYHTMTYKCKNGVISKAFEYYPSYVNKGNGVKFLIDKYNRIPFTIGDYLNDVDLISSSKYGAATLEAPKEIKKLAKYVTCSVKEGAVADYIGYIKTILRGS